MQNIRHLVGKNIRKYRLERKFTQEQLAGMAELNSAFISRVELGKMNIGIDALGKIGRAMNVEVQRFFEEEKPI